MQEGYSERVKRELNSRQIFSVHFGQYAAEPPVFGEAAPSKQIAKKTASKPLVLGREILMCITCGDCLVLHSSGGGGQLIRGAGGPAVQINNIFFEGFAS